MENKSSRKDKVTEVEGRSVKGVSIIFVDYLKWIRGHKGKRSQKIHCRRSKVSLGSRILKERICSWEYLIQFLSALPPQQNLIFLTELHVSSSRLWSTKDVKPQEEIFAWIANKGQSKHHCTQIVRFNDLATWTDNISERSNKSIQFRSLAQLCPTLRDPMDCSTPAFPVQHELPKLTQTHVPESVVPSSHLILCHPLLLPPSIFPSIRGFSNESVLHIRWPKYWNFCFSICPAIEY